MYRATFGSGEEPAQGRGGGEPVRVQVTAGTHADHVDPDGGGAEVTGARDGVPGRDLLGAVRRLRFSLMRQHTST
jgi:hypothetical protein